MAYAGVFLALWRVIRVWTSRVSATPVAAPQQSRATSLTCPERPSTKSWMVHEQRCAQHDGARAARRAVGRECLHADESQHEVLAEMGALAHDVVGQPLIGQPHAGQAALQELEHASAEGA